MFLRTGNYRQPSWRASTLGCAAAVLLANPGFEALAQQGNHGEGHDKFHAWYQTLKQPLTGMSCCSGKDCRPTSIRRIDGMLEVEVDGEWIPAPRDRVLDAPSPDLGAHVCAAETARHWPRWLKQDAIYCVVLGDGT